MPRWPRSRPRTSARTPSPMHPRRVASMAAMVAILAVRAAGVRERNLTRQFTRNHGQTKDYYGYVFYIRRKVGRSWPSSYLLHLARGRLRVGGVARIRHQGPGDGSGLGIGYIGAEFQAIEIELVGEPQNQAFRRRKLIAAFHHGPGQGGIIRD